jgi:hypothetical protein
MTAPRIDAIVTYTAECPCGCGPVEWTQTAYHASYIDKMLHAPAPTYDIACQTRRVA